MKKIILLLLISLSVFADVKVNLIEAKIADYQNGIIGGGMFRVICINGYQWLQSGEGNTSSISQMFENNIVYAGGMKMYNVSAIKCENK